MKRIRKTWLILSWLLTLVLTFSLVGVVLPANQAEADPGTLEWSEINNPNSTGTYATFVIAQSDIIDIEVCSDGTMFAAFKAEADNAFYKSPDGTAMVTGDYGILKSTSGGTVWSATGFDQAWTEGWDLTPGTADDTPIVAIAASPDYDSDTTLWVATTTQCYRTISGGTTFGAVSWGTTALLATETITSIDVALDYLSTGLNVVVGTSDATGSARVLVFIERMLDWTNLDTGMRGTAGLDRMAAFVAFSPLYESDGEIIAAVVDGVDTDGAGPDTTGTYIQACFSERAWNTEVMNATISVIAVDASIAFPGDYDSISTNQIFVGIDSGLVTDAGDVWRIIGQRPPEMVSVPVDLNCHPAGTYNVCSIAVSGTISAVPTVTVGSADSAEVRKTSNPLDTVPSWKSDIKGPTGTGAIAETVIALATDFASSGVMYAATCGVDSSLCRSSDSGSVFNGIALIDTVIAAIADAAAYNADTVFMITDDGLGMAESLWRTTNGGKAWERVYSDIGLAQVKLSPAYATDSTFYVSEGGISTSMWKSSNGGDTIVGIAAMDVVSAWTVIDGSTVIIGADDNNIYKTTNSGLRWTCAETPPDGVAITIAVSPDYATNSTVIIGTANGRVYISTDGGRNFSRIGIVGPGSVDDNIYVAFDPAYASNSVIYAGSGNQTTEGIFRWKVDVSTEWELIDDAGAIDLLLRALVLSVSGVLYAVNASPGTGMERSEFPTAPLGIVQDSFQTVNDALTPTAILVDLEAVAGSSTVLFAIDSANCQLQSYTDTKLGEVETAIVEDQDLDGVVVIPVTIVRVKDPVSGETVPGVQIADYVANLTFTPGFMEILEIRGGDPPFDTIPPENIVIDNIAGTASVSDDVSPSGTLPSIIIFRIIARLNDSCLVSDNLTVNVVEVSDPGGIIMNAQDQPMILTFQRGDIQKPVDGYVDIIDAMFGAQYVVGIRSVDDIRQLNMASVKHDDTGDKKDIIDCMFIAQKVVGIRDELFYLTEMGPTEEYHNVSSAVIAMMVDNALTEIPNPISASANATNDMTAFPDCTSVAGSADKVTDPDGVAYTAADDDGYLLYGHDRTGGGVSGPAVNYVNMAVTTYYYTCDAHGTVHQWDEPGGTEITY